MCAIGNKHINFNFSIEFDKDGEYFVVAGVTKKIKVYAFRNVVDNADALHYPLTQLQCNSKIRLDWFLILFLLAELTGIRWEEWREKKGLRGRGREELTIWTLYERSREKSRNGGAKSWLDGVLLIKRAACFDSSVLNSMFWVTRMWINVEILSHSFFFRSFISKGRNDYSLYWSHGGKKYTLGFELSRWRL